MAIRSWRVADIEVERDSGVIRRMGLWRVDFGLVGVLSLIGFFDFTSFFPCHPPRIRLVMAKLGRPWRGAKVK